MEGMMFSKNINAGIELAKKHGGSIILYGKRGSGMHYKARELASFFLGTDAIDAHPDFLEITDEEKNIRKEDVMEIVRLAGTTPVCGKCHVFLIDDAERLSAENQNVLLKTLEEKTGDNVFLLVTHRPMIDTVASRSVTVMFLPPARTAYGADCDEIAYAASCGTPGAYIEVMEDAEFRDFLEKVPAAMTDRKSLFALMGVLNEKEYKDSQFFLSASGRKIGYFFNFAAYALSKAYCRSLSGERELAEVYMPLLGLGAERLSYMLEVTEEHRNQSSGTGYGKSEFYSYLHRITEEEVR